MRDEWNQPPGASAPRSIPRSLRTILASFLVGVISIGVAWAGASLVPINDLSGDDSLTSTAKQSKTSKAPATDRGFQDAISFASLDEAGQILAGAAKVSIEPKPEAYGGIWEQNKKKCTTLPPNEESFPAMATHVADFRVRWAENSNCIYMGGYGIGPMNPIVSWDNEYGLWARSVAMSDGTDTVVLTLLDAVYWEGRYNSLCDACGFLDLADQLATETGLKPESFIFASTHSHTSPDFIGGWGGVPSWYMDQVTDALKDSAKAAVASMKPAVLETGEVVARQFNGERRDFYRSAEDDGVSWFRLVAADDLPKEETCVPGEPTPTEPTNQGNGNGYGNAGKATPAPAPTPICSPADPGTAIATVGAYAAHPVTADESTGQADADFPAVFAKRVEEAFGGTGMFLQTGLGNLSPRGDKVTMGNGLASLIPAIGTGEAVADPNVRVGRTGWNQPVTNIPLGTLGVAGFFDRRFNQLPAAVREGKGPENRKCISASPVSVDTTVSAAKIGSLWITGAPGEIFANYSNTIEEGNPNGVTMALGLVNDGLGYIIQSFETDHVGRQAAGFVGKAGPVGIAEYEDAYSIDHCFGDAALEKTLALLGTL
ncbi:MAG: hypothetical protein ACLGIB_09205 [Actinomycetota bacterium]